MEKTGPTLPRFGVTGKLPAQGLELTGSKTIPLRIPRGGDPLGLEVKLKITGTLVPVAAAPPCRRAGAGDSERTAALHALRPEGLRGGGRRLPGRSQQSVQDALGVGRGKR